MGHGRISLDARYRMVDITDIARYRIRYQGKKEKLQKIARKLIKIGRYLISAQDIWSQHRNAMDISIFEIQVDIGYQIMQVLYPISNVRNGYWVLDESQYPVS